MLESKRQNKLLRMAINRLKAQIDNPVDMPRMGSDDETNGNTFLTESKHVPLEKPKELSEMKKVAQPLDQYGISTIQDSKEKDT